MKNMLTDLQNHLFEQMETLNDKKLTGIILEIEIIRTRMLIEVAKTAIARGLSALRRIENETS